jgi:uncharacterized SAM-binding protein YcdF (DUF218 family)
MTRQVNTSAYQSIRIEGCLLKFLSLLFGIILLLILSCLSPTINLLDRLIAVPDHIQKADVIVAFSASKLNNCTAHSHVFLRENYAAALLRMGYSQSKQLVISGLYTRYPNRLDECRTRLARLFRIPAQQLIIENQSHTTYDNARHVSKLMRHHGWKTAVLVTSRSHMFRALHTLEKQGIKAYPRQIPDFPPYHDAWLDANRVRNLKRLLYEYGALMKYKWYGFI